MATRPPTHDDLVQHIVLNRLVSKNVYYLRGLIDAHANSQLSAAAWHTRNLLEIFIWSGYCISSRVNAKRFCLDAVRDAKDILDIYKSGELEELPHVREQLEQWNNLQSDLTQIFGAGEVEKRYQSVRTIARDLGALAPFDTQFKYLSKFIHPTALIVMMDKIPGETEKATLDSIAHTGIELATATAKITKKFCLEARAKFQIPHFQ